LDPDSLIFRAKNWPIDGAVMNASNVATGSSQYLM